MLGLILLFALAWTCARAFESAKTGVSAKHKKRMKKAAKKKGRRTGAKTAAWAATGATAAATFLKAFLDGWKREWPKAKKRATARFDKAKRPQLGDDISRDGTPRTKTPPKPAEAPRKTPAAKPALTLIKNPEPDAFDHLYRTDNQGVDHMALATIPEITGVNTLKSAVARFASEANVTAEEAGAIAQRAADQLAAIEAAIEQAGALEFGDDGGTLQELAALRDQYAAAYAAAQGLQKAAVDNAAIASQSSKNIHDRHGGIQEAVAATGGRMASKQAYTADV